MGPGAYLHPLWQGKGAFLSCLDQSLLQDTSIIINLDNNAAVSNSGQGYWECRRVGGTSKIGSCFFCRHSKIKLSNAVFRSQIGEV